MDKPAFTVGELIMAKELRNLIVSFDTRVAEWLNTLSKLVLSDPRITPEDCFSFFYLWRTDDSSELTTLAALHSRDHIHHSHHIADKWGDETVYIESQNGYACIDDSNSRHVMTTCIASHDLYRDIDDVAKECADEIVKAREKQTSSPT